jgi:hypothetical protein
MEGMKLRLVAVLAAASLIGLVFASAAKADSVSVSNSAVSMSVSLMNGSNALTAKAGDSVAASASVTNLLDANAYVRIYAFCDWDKGWSPTMNKLKKLKDGDTWDMAGQFKVGLFTPPGIYQFHLKADSPGLPLLEADASILVL